MPAKEPSFFTSFPLWIILLFGGIFVAGFLYQVIITIRLYYYRKPVSGRLLGLNCIIGIFTTLPLSVIYHVYKMESINTDYYSNPVRGMEMVLAGLDFLSAIIPVVGVGWMVMFQAFISKILNKTFRLMNLWGLMIVTLAFFNMYFISSPPVQPHIETFYSLLMFASVIVFIIGLGMLVAPKVRKRIKE
jgi:hypothetical protein